MANSVNWGKIYCYTEFGDEDHTIAESIPDFSAPDCFVDSLTGDLRETKALTVDTTLYTADSTILQADQITVQL